MGLPETQRPPTTTTGTLSVPHGVKADLIDPRRYLSSSDRRRPLALLPRLSPPHDTAFGCSSALPTRPLGCTAA
eukprot:7511531-Pyramimonas_sp.AAC.1